MDVILSHEQADFDAIAALLGAHILHDSAIPVLPRKTNKNVKDFLRLYASDLPFIQMADAPKKAIKSVTLVDTQSLVTLKGFSARTEVTAIDHHPKRQDTPQKWNFQFVPYGATTTYFVEQIMDRNNYHLNVVEATLLLLGIYEDTGTLTYTNTTAHEASAVAYLLSKNANLEIATQFLNPPLSASQQQVFQKLLENSQHIKMNGLEILLAVGSAPDLEDEVSSIAHKINDLFDPDALFIFVALKEGIRLVARSSTDRVDTMQIAGMYGGGGHLRASAALINYDDTQPNQLVAIQENFLSMLHEYIQPAISVANIMSKKPLTLKPTTTVEEARHLMERYGYEGFPVLEHGRVIGLLNRRAVDKAVTHHLNKTASSLMEAGNYFVTADDSLKHLQQVMAESGWGQIPVISSDEGSVIGIVTRTDLLKALTGDRQPNRRLNLAQSIKENTSAGELQLLEMISRKATELNLPIYLVGGFVRDLILQKPSPDFDIVVEGDAIRLSRVLAETYGGKVTSHKKFGTAKWWPLDPSGSAPHTELQLSDPDLNTIPATVDLISARTEFYEKPTALPTIKQSSIKLDLHRRDFTINTMAVRLDGAYFGDVYDYWGGLNDLENKLVRVLHSLSFVDDPTRMLRAVRFEKRFSFKIEARTLELLEEAISLIDDVSGDRLRHELDQIFIEEQVSEMLRRLQQLGILAQIHPSLRWDEELSQNLADFFELAGSDILREHVAIDSDEKRIQATYIILLCRFLPAHLQEVIQRLRFKSNIQQLLLSANALWHNQERLAGLSPGEFTDEVEKYPPLTLLTVSVITKNQEFSKKIRKFMSEWREIRIFTTGEDLMRLKIPPGPIYRRILKHLRIARINGEIGSKESERRLLEELLTKIT